MKLKIYTNKRDTWFNFGFSIYAVRDHKIMYCLELNIPYIEWYIVLRKETDNPSYKD